MPLPAHVLVGAATAAHQVEGGNINSDWWEWEQRADGPCAEPSGDACDHLNRWPEDLQIMADLGLDAYRFTLEWARIEPERGQVSRAALAHYRRMLTRCHELGITPIVTLQHFTLPRWVARAGGWSEATTGVRFQEFAHLIASELGDLLSWVCTINEPNVVLDSAYLHGLFPPGRTGDVTAHTRALQVVAASHQMARNAIKAAAPHVKVGLTLSMLDAQPQPGAEEQALAHLADAYGGYLQAVADDDFLGVQCYTVQHVGADGPMPAPRGVERTQNGWEYTPEASANLCRRLSAMLPDLPLLISENGIATGDDARRVDYLDRSVAAFADAIADGVDVRGYLHWSLLDNFEWNLGYRATFGLIAVDPITFERTVKPSARRLGEIARERTA